MTLTGSTCWNEAFLNDRRTRTLFDRRHASPPGPDDAGFSRIQSVPRRKDDRRRNHLFLPRSRGTRTTSSSSTTIRHCRDARNHSAAERAMTLPTISVSPTARTVGSSTCLRHTAASFGVLDPAKYSVIGEIDTAGCGARDSFGPNRVSSLCESGRAAHRISDAGA